MSMKVCPVCETMFRDGDKIVAVMIASYCAIPSDVNVAISHPEKCIEIVHSSCYDWEDYPEDDETEMA